MAPKVDYVHLLWNLMQTLENQQLENALSDAFEDLINLLEVRTGIMWLKNNESKRIYSVISVGDENVSGFNIEFGQGIIGEACESFSPIEVKDVASDKRFPSGKDEVTGLNIKNVLFMPMIFGNQVVGCVEVINRVEKDDFLNNDLSLLHAFAGLSAMVIDERGFKTASETKKKTVMSLRGVKKDYKAGQETINILKGVDLDIYEKELLVILGESGCGKSTLLNIIGGMDSPTEGDIKIDGRDFSHPTEKELIKFRRDDIGFIFQAYNLMPNLTALENIMFIAEICNNPRDSKEALDMVGLSDRANNYPSMMSGGQQQRVSIARAIVKNPRIILADEPTAALDFTTGQEVLQLIESIIKDGLTTVVMVTHNVEIAKMANRVVHMKNGKIASIRLNSWPMHAADLVW
ncbi:ATP-binding cassette domain-containing protein [Butyrivibrio sp. XPD2002]|uniref:ATP-binding cassette domain-containing protein n=1 Tax=Butyrivibrio sp. XPD2002 TaxID=1280665 RepID=UPI000400EDA1|nr:ATP-binding cassette domain-containing protein [Butyrivibrio sp. XPD2002]